MTPEQFLVNMLRQPDILLAPPEPFRNLRCRVPDTNIDMLVFIDENACTNGDQRQITKIPKAGNPEDTSDTRPLQRSSPLPGGRPAPAAPFIRTEYAPMDFSRTAGTP